jgi:hypothetical protein
MRETEHVLTEIQKVITEDPTIQDAQHVVVTVESAGLFKGQVIVLKGHVRSDIDKAKVASLAHAHAGGMSVRDSVTVTH